MAKPKKRSIKVEQGVSGLYRRYSNYLHDSFEKGKSEATLNAITRLTGNDPRTQLTNRQAKQRHANIARAYFSEVPTPSNLYNGVKHWLSSKFLPDNDEKSQTLITGTPPSAIIKNPSTLVAATNISKMLNDNVASTKLKSAASTVNRLFTLGTKKRQVKPSIGFADAAEDVSNKLFLNKLNAFADKYGYPGLSTKGHYSRGELNAYAKAILDRHNSFYRGVYKPVLEEDIRHIKTVLGKGASDDEILKYVATHPREGGVSFLSPTSNAAIYAGSGNSAGRLAIVKRPYSLGNNRMNWFNEGDFTLLPANSGAEEAGRIIDPWVYPMSRSWNPSIPNELVSRTPLDFVSFISPKKMFGYLSRNRHFKGPDKWYPYYRDSYRAGGTIHIKPENRGKFNALKKRTGKTTEELTHSKNPLTRKRAIFAQNARKWNHKKK